MFKNVLTELKDGGSKRREVAEVEDRINQFQKTGKSYQKIARFLLYNTDIGSLVNQCCICSVETSKGYYCLYPYVLDICDCVADALESITEKRILADELQRHLRAELESLWSSKDLIFANHQQ